MKKPRSPSERKIGLVRRRSQEMARKSSIRESQRDLEQSRNRQNLMKMQCSEGKSPGPLHRGKPNTFNVRPSPLKVISGKKSTGSPSYRIKMSFKEGQIQNPRVIPKTKDKLWKRILKEIFRDANQKNDDDPLEKDPKFLV